MRDRSTFTGGDEVTQPEPARGAPGATTRTASLPVQRKAAAAPSAPSGESTDAGRTGALLDAMFDFTGGGFARAGDLAAAPVQRKGDGESDAGGFDRAVTGGAGALPHRAAMETAFGRDFSHVESHTAQPDALRDLGATAAARGDQVAFADASPSPWLVAHELAHVVQHQQAGPGVVNRHAMVGAADSAAEREADRVADRVVSGLGAGPITSAPAAPVQRFAPGNHEQATIGGLKGSYSREEIAATYASNWERDFSQGAPEIANAAIAWRAAKLAAGKNDGDPGAAGETFKTAVWAVIDMNLTASTNESLGNYRYWEHMDQPEGGVFERDPRVKANQRWAAKANGLAGYLMDAKAHIKDQMVAAVDVYRNAHNTGSAGAGIDNWNGAARPDGYVAPDVSRDAATGNTHSMLPGGWDPDNVVSRDPLREQTSNLAGAAGARSDSAHNEELWKVVGQHLGRAMHAFEDFWAHSNWLELAHGLIETREGGGEDTQVDNGQLKTGTFGMSSKAHALGHKLLALSSAFLADFPLMLKIYGRTEASTAISHDKRRPWYYGVDSDSDDAFDGLVTDSATPAGEIADVGRAANAVEELVQSGDYSMADFLCNREWLEALKNKGKILIAEGDKESDENAHGKIAKDQDEEGKDHSGAQALAEKANELTFGPLRAIMDQRDLAKATAAIQTQLAMVDSMLAAPSTSHPLWALVQTLPAGGHEH